MCVWQKLVSPAGPDQGTGATVNQQPSSVTDLDIATLDHHNHITEPLVNMPSEAMQSKIKKIYKPVLFVSTNFLCLSPSLISQDLLRAGLGLCFYAKAGICVYNKNILIFKIAKLPI